MPARSSVTSSAVAQATRPFFTRDLFNAFQSHCGGCHVDTNLGGFDGERITLDNFATLVDAKALELIQGDDPDTFMPKPVAGGIPWSSRSADDPVRQLAELLEIWIAAGSPEDVFFLPPETGAEETRYLLAPEQGATLTNIGNCLPDKAWFATEKAEAPALDQMWAAATALPDRLEQTDLTTLDHAELGYRGVVAFAPAYPLWSDDAGKIRHVRVPQGTSIHYERDSGEFTIPDNTRFYKTFLKQVIDADGKHAYRKMETRLIVVRQDICTGEGCTPQSLFGTYAWNDEETEAVLVKDPLRSGAPFRDRVVTYLTDEVKGAAAGTDAEALAATSRHYAIPGSERCVQCHMGSSSKSFILGFTPLQMHRRPYVEEPDMFAVGGELLGHGVLKEDAPSVDEQAQLGRLIELGVVTGIEDPDTEVPGLRDVGTAPPRSGFELEAQGYLLGNCASCHNERGFPSRKHPELLDLLNFYPDANGGIYQFPLERYSPRVRRGASGEIDVPYISPSIWDVNRNGATGYAEKCIPTGTSEPACVEAPWRSLIYRNVDTPFTYSDDYAIFPHMPRHGSSFDCRAPRLLANWMVSIPSEVKAEADPPAAPGAEPLPEQDRLDAQVRSEVSPEDADYDAAVEEARARLAAYQAGERYTYCPDTSDIQDPDVLAGLIVVPADNGQLLPDQPFVPWRDGVPDRAHWVVMDTTNVPGDWSPRRADWADILLGADPEKVAGLGADERKVVDALGAADLAITPEFRAYALTQVPFGFWKDTDGACDAALSEMPTLSEFPDDELPRWVKESARVMNVEMETPLYELAPGAAVFANICRNCHGPAGDGDSPLAGTIAEVTGGTARVANLRDGLFGPISSPGSGRELVFGAAAQEAGLSSEDLSARYLLWMTLGGTQVQIPQMALNFVDNTLILGERRYREETPASANMLNTARSLCSASLALDRAPKFNPFLGFTYGDLHKLIFTNGDAELWTELCAYHQTGPVRVVSYPSWNPQNEVNPAYFQVAQKDGLPQMIDPSVYGASPVMTSHGVVVGVPEGEPVSWCVEKPLEAEALALADAYFGAHLVDGLPVPYCPDGLATWELARMDEFALRGAMNAGLAAFIYLDALASGEALPQLQYDECKSLAP